MKNDLAETTKLIKFTYSQKNVLNKAKIFSEKFFSDFERTGKTQLGGHGFDHAQRVTGLTAFLAIYEKYDPFLPILAAILHDVGRASQDKRSVNFLHGQLSREICHNFLVSLNLPKQDLQMVENAIEDHPFLNEKVRESYVVKLLMDADRLDGMGAISPVRASAQNWKLPIYTNQDYSDTKDTSINSIYGHFGVRIPQWFDMMWTKKGKLIAKKRLKFLEKFNQEFKEEIFFMQGCFDNLKI